MTQFISILEKGMIFSAKIVFIEKSSHLGANLIKIIIGPRRDGKSAFACLLLKGKNFAYLNFDDENLLKVKIMIKLSSVYLKFMEGKKKFFLMKSKMLGVGNYSSINFKGAVII